MKTCPNCGHNLEEDKQTCSSCTKFKLDGVEFPSIGKCTAGSYLYSKKTTDICDNPSEYKKKK